MALPDSIRHIIAILIALVCFWIAFMQVNLVWWIALLSAVAVYFACLLLILPSKSRDQIRLADRVSAADIDKAAREMKIVEKRLKALEKRALKDDQSLFETMRSHVTSIRSAVESDPADYLKTRQFIHFFLPKIADISETYVDLSLSALPSDKDRILALRGQVQDFEPRLARLASACHENDFRAVEIEVEVLNGQMKKF